MLDTPAPSPVEARSSMTTRALAPGVLAIDNMLPDESRARVHDYLNAGGWKFGWKSRGKTDTFSFWHRHFAGHRHAKQETQYACAGELEKNSALIFWFWRNLNKTVFADRHVLYRCYANAQAYGSDGTLHKDSKSARSFTSIYYPHASWQPDWAGETLVFTPDESDVHAAIYPKPNRLVIFPGNLPHVARGVSRICPALRVVLVFKSEAASDDQGRIPAVPAGDAAHGRDPA